MRDFFHSLNPLGWAFLAYTVAFPPVLWLYTGSWFFALIFFLVCVAYLAVSP